MATQTITGPLSSLAKRANEVSEGNLEGEPLRVESSDEVGVVTTVEGVQENIDIPAAEEVQENIEIPDAEEVSETIETPVTEEQAAESEIKDELAAELSIFS